MVTICAICERQSICTKRQIKWNVLQRGKYKSLYGAEDYESSININICKSCNDTHKNIETCGWDKWDALDNISVKDYTHIPPEHSSSVYSACVFY